MEGVKYKMGLDECLKLVSVYGFPMVVAVYLIVKLEYFVRQIAVTNEKVSVGIRGELKGIKRDINKIKKDIEKIKKREGENDK